MPGSVLGTRKTAENTIAKPALLKFIEGDAYVQGSKKRRVNFTGNNQFFSIVQADVVLLTYGCIFLFSSSGIGPRKVAGAWGSYLCNPSFFSKAGSYKHQISCYSHCGVFWFKTVY